MLLLYQFIKENVALERCTVLQVALNQEHDSIRYYILLDQLSTLLCLFTKPFCC